MIVYSGSNGERTKNLAHNIVVELTEGLRDRGHHLYFNNCYCSISTVEYLATRGIGCTGTIRKNRKMLPSDIKNPPKTLLNGESLFKKEGNLVCLVYKDKKEVRILTNLHTNQKDTNGRPIALKD